MPPEGAAIIGAVCGIVVMQFPWTALFMPFLWLFSGDKKWIFAAFAGMTLLSVLIQGSPVAGKNPKKETWVTAVFEVTDSGLCRLPDVPRPGLIKAKLIKTTGADGAELPLSGRILVRLPEGSGIRPFAGDVLEGEGILSPPHGSFGQYALSNRVKWTLLTEECRKTGVNRRSFIRWISSCREYLLARAVEHLETPERRRAAASLFFGVRGGLDPVERQKLVHAGVIHLYSVSGLHVGIFAGVLMLFLRGLPGRWKYGVLIPATLLYVISTGCNVPAVRAWLMLSSWAACRMCLYWLPVRRVLGYTAALLLIWQPAWLYDMGFLYSFEITLILLLLGQNLQACRKIFSDPAWMMPRTVRRNRMYRFLKIRNFILAAIFSCVAAFLGGAATGLMFQGRFLPGSVAANLLLMPVVGVVFPVMTLKVVTGWGWAVWDRCLAWCIERLWDLMDGVIAGIQYLDATVTGIPPLWSAVLFLTGLLLCLTPELSRRVRVAGAVICGVLLLGWHGSMLFRSSAVLVVHGNYAEVPAVAVADCAGGVGIAVNVPDSAAAVKMAEFFLAHGLTEVDRVLVSSPRSGNIRGLKTLTQHIRVRQFVLPELDRYSGGFRKKMLELNAASGGIPVTERSGGAEITYRKDRWGVEYRNPASRKECRIFFVTEPEMMIVNGRKIPYIRSSETVEHLFLL